MTLARTTAHGDEESTAPTLPRMASSPGKHNGRTESNDGNGSLGPQQVREARKGGGSRVRFTEGRRQGFPRGVCAKEEGGAPGQSPH